MEEDSYVQSLLSACRLVLQKMDSVGDFFATWTGTIETCMVDFIKGTNVIKVIEGYELKEGADIQSLFLKLRSYAMTFPGFISAEHIRSVKGTSIAALLYNWKGLENWEAWESSKLRQQMLQEAEALLLSEPRITTYEVVPTSAWTYTGLKP